MSSKTATLNCRVNPDVKQQAEAILSRLGIPMSTAIDMYLQQINLVWGDTVFGNTFKTFIF